MPNCCREFHSRARLRAHLRTSPLCLARLRACFPPLKDEQMSQLDVADRAKAADLKRQGWLPTKALLPVARVYGPALPEEASEASQTMAE